MTRKIFDMGRGIAKTEFRVGDVAYLSVEFVIKLNEEGHNFICDNCDGIIRNGDRYGDRRGELAPEPATVCLKCLIKPN